MTAAYLVPARRGTALVEVKRSRFHGSVLRVGTEAEARAAVEAARREHPDARHHCWAFLLGAGGAVARSSDDGEPGGTAGAPMLEVLRGAGVSDAVVVVTRWFGGVLLGAGGLVRAYGDTARAALEDAGVLHRVRAALLAVTVDHAGAARLEHELRARGVLVREVRYGRAATLTLQAPPGAAEGDVDGMVRALTGGRARAVAAGEAWVDSPVGPHEGSGD